jgi:hypothetical protein
LRPAFQRGHQRILRELLGLTTSRSIRASPAISFGDSMRQMASMLRWMSVFAMAADHSSIGASNQVACEQPPTQHL